MPSRVVGGDTGSGRKMLLANGFDANLVRNCEKTCVEST